MEERLKQRLIGGAVLVSLMVIFVPMLLEEKVVIERGLYGNKIPEKPKVLQRPLETQTILPEPIARLEPQPQPQSKPVEPPAEKVEPAKPDADQRFGKIKRPTHAAWMVQVASFTKQENAKKLVERMKQAGLPAQMKAVKIDSKQHYRVQMLPQLDKKQAEKMVEKIHKKFGLKASVVRYAG